MPIYAYRCSSCGFHNDYLQKVSDPVLSTCPECGKETFAKQLTAAGFQLKGSGWYVTDFRDNGAKPAAKSNGEGDAGKADAGKTEAGKVEGGKSDGGKSEAGQAKSDSKPDSSVAPSTGTGATPACS